MTVIRKVLTVFGYRSNDTELARVNRAVDQTKARSLSASTAVGALGGAFRAAAGAATKLVAATSALAVAGGAALAWNIGKDLIEADKLFATLETFEGSTAKAEIAWKRLQKFAAETPFQITNVVKAYNQLSALNMDTSEEAMRAWADVAGATSVDITEAVGAVASVIKGESDPIEAWGVSAKFAGDKVKLTFDGVTTTMKRDAAAIQKYLMGVSKQKYFGGAARQVDTLGGKISNIKDKMFEFSLAVGKGGAKDALMSFLKTVLKLQDALAGTGPILGKLMTKGIDKLTNGLQWFIDNPKKIGRFFGILIGSFKLVYRTVSKVVTKIRELAPMLAKIALTMAGGKVLGGLAGMGGRAGSAAGGVSLLGSSLGLLSFGLTDVAAAAMGLPSITGMLFPDLTPEDIQDSIKGIGETLKGLGKGLFQGLTGTKVPWDDPEVMNGALDAAYQKTRIFIGDSADLAKDAFKSVGDSLRDGSIKDVFARGGWGLDEVPAETIGEALGKGLRSLATPEAWSNAFDAITPEGAKPGKFDGASLAERHLGYRYSDVSSGLGVLGGDIIGGAATAATTKGTRNRQWDSYGMLPKSAQTKITNNTPIEAQIVNNITAAPGTSPEELAAIIDERTGDNLQALLRGTMEEMRPSTTGATS